ncbi:BZ3500_MvSof-1268-A1-R1_Chr1-3g01737 [Microbotryum saponariae]|uniref:BZ3500_MvSof-1268-A1-R1_Chr1-3g01737 protein n=1 Tax=Microbotryum saponariae TaxID=289078 RepID=A0A2X0KCG9_9BASI|nr:BZ3500_MvSof-1268-A1-R1_Chr1-3g01737 [Microbotryum saponariae]SCZ94476.1 BZ3501_MvSof-1269-A2-R1_Chr1-3g01339 [Microbotryum saponariae]
MSIPPPPVDFAYLHDSLQQDADLREKIRDAVRDVEREERAIQAVLNRVHSVTKQQGPLEVTELLTSAASLSAPLQSSIAKLASLIPTDQFYRYNDQFSRALQVASFLIVFARFLLQGDVPSKNDVESSLGIQPEWKDHFFLPTEEYLHSLISLLNELSIISMHPPQSRLAVNRVTLGDYESPLQFSQFAKELSTAFGLLSLKNDSLRKRFDSIKYDLKKLEEGQLHTLRVSTLVKEAVYLLACSFRAVVYDLSLRGLLKSASAVASTLSTMDEEQAPTKRGRMELASEG